MPPPHTHTNKIPTLQKKNEKTRFKGPSVTAGSFDWVAVMTATHNHRHHSWPSDRKALNIWPTRTDFHLCYEKLQIFPPTASWEKKQTEKRNSLMRQRTSNDDASCLSSPRVSDRKETRRWFTLWRQPAKPVAGALHCCCSCSVSTRPHLNNSATQRRCHRLLHSVWKIL